ncbi:MAG: rhomboid family intramembrane serine protease [Lewinellaceae bacterium]|nr:rhomboid family intramembrane serine protease [Lewinellaceae bacterium]
MSITYIIIIVTALVSFLAFNNQELFVKLKHWPYQEERRGEYYRWFTSGFLHADPMHLIFNMLTLYFFGEFVESAFGELFGGLGPAVFLIFYVAAIIAASSATFIKYKHTSGFASIGASGAVAAVLFAAILFNPTIGIRMFFIPIDIPGFVFGILYLWYSSYEAKRGRDNIDHLAHFFGAVFGFFFPIFSNRFCSSVF